MPPYVYEQLIAVPEKLDMVYRFKIQGAFKSVPPDSVVVRKFYKWQRRKGQSGDVRVVDPPAPPAAEPAVAEEPVAEEPAADVPAAEEAPAAEVAPEPEAQVEPAIVETAVGATEEVVQVESPVEEADVPAAAPAAAPAEAAVPVEN